MPWSRAAELCLVLLVFGGAGAGFDFFFVDPSSNSTVLAFAGCAGLAGAIAWAVCCGHRSQRAHTNWIACGMLAGVLCHPIFGLMCSFMDPQFPFLAVPVVALFGFFLWGMWTVPLGVIAAVICDVLMTAWHSRKGAIKSSTNRPNQLPDAPASSTLGVRTGKPYRYSPPAPDDRRARPRPRLRSPGRPI